VPVCLLRIRGELAIGAHLRATDLYAVGSLILTMMQSCASAAKLRAAGPFSRSASSARFEYGFPPPRIVNSAVVLKASARRMVLSGMLVPASPFNRHSPDSRVVERDFPSHRGALQRNSIATASVRSQIAGLPASQCWNSLLCLHQGAPLPSPSVASDPHLPVMPVPVAPAAGRSTTGFPGTSALAPRPRPFGRLRSGRG
jgi:hypothetical protein